MAGLKGLAAQIFAKHNIAQEFDPELDPPDDSDDASRNGDPGSDSEGSAPEDTRDTEHYAPVGKSKLRRNLPVELGLAYRGKRVSREELERGSGDEEGEEADSDEDEEAFDDPDEVDLEGAEDVDSEDEIDSDDALGSDDEGLVKRFTFRGSAKPKTPQGKPSSGSDDDDDEEDDAAESGEEEEEEEEDDDEGVEDLGSDGSDDEDNSEEDDEDEDEDEDSTTVDPSTARAAAETRKILAEDRKQVLASLSQAAKADADKGFAVRQQRRTFDALLNMRIRMQKALSAANSLHVVSTPPADGAAMEAAASQAVALLDSIQSIRTSFYTGAAAGSGAAAKRKHDGSCAAVFAQMTEVEDAARAKRRKVLDRWAARVQRPSASAAAAASRRFTAQPAQQALTAVLDGQLVTPERLIRRTRTPRSCAPVQAARRVQEDAEVYDDADFYQLLLKELVDQRTVDASAPGSAAPIVRWATAAAKDAKTRKVVDRRASKGRKMRFNVHEKLQNFMAPEDRREWEPEAIDRFFSSLFGQRMALREDDGADEDEDADADDDEDAAAGGASLGDSALRLF